MAEGGTVVTAFERFVQGFNSGDPAAFAAAIAEDETSFVAGTQRVASGRTEWLGNYQALVDRKLVGPAGAGVRLEASDVRGFDEGDAASGFGWLTLFFPDGAHLPTRATVVFRRDKAQGLARAPRALLRRDTGRDREARGRRMAAAAGTEPGVGSKDMRAGLARRSRSAYCRA